MNTTNAYRLVSLICGAMCLILAIGGQAIAGRNLRHGRRGVRLSVGRPEMSTARYLSLKEVGERIGTSNPAARGYHLPEPDALIGTTRGWLPETIDAWNAARPGRGAGGGRPRKNRNQADSPTA